MGDALAGLIPAFAPFDRIALDTEADSLHCYFEKLCLIQVSIPGADWLIDPLANLSLMPLFDALKSKQVIFHGADYDLRLLRRVGFTECAGVFDTMIAARLSGVPEFSLAALLKRHFALEIPKASQKANWARRPLPATMLDYAVNDTRHLHRLAEIYEAELRQLGRWDWFVQSCERAVRVTETVKDRDDREAWRISGAGALRGHASAILRELWLWRDGEARAVDRPSFHILHNSQLIEATHQIAAGKTAEFAHLRGGRLDRYRAAVQRAVHLPESDWPKIVRTHRARPTREEEERFRQLKEKRDAVAAELKLDPSLIAPKASLEALASESPAEAEERMMPWQVALLDLR
ncbi:MAG: HRDC domain-containing protein [Chthoniobacteraceae bacterium]